MVSVIQGRVKFLTFGKALKLNSVNEKHIWNLKLVTVSSAPLLFFKLFSIASDACCVAYFFNQKVIILSKFFFEVHVSDMVGSLKQQLPTKDVLSNLFRACSLITDQNFDALGELMQKQQQIFKQKACSDQKKEVKEFFSKSSNLQVLDLKKDLKVIRVLSFRRWRSDYILQIAFISNYSSTR